MVIHYQEYQCLWEVQNLPAQILANGNIWQSSDHTL